MDTCAAQGKALMQLQQNNNSRFLDRRRVGEYLFKLITMIGEAMQRCIVAIDLIAAVCICNARCNVTNNQQWRQILAEIGLTSRRMRLAWGKGSSLYGSNSQLGVS